MDFVIASGSVTLSNRDLAPGSGAPGWFTSGNPGTGVQATVLPGYWPNMIQAEIGQVITDAGLTRDKTNWAQLSAAIRAMISTGPFTNGSGSFGPAGSLGNTGTTNWTVPAGITKIRVRCWGAGGGGGGSQASPSAASGGAYCEGVYTVTPGQVIAVTAGLAGALGAAGGNNAGSAGGDSSFGAFCTAHGGTGGLGASTNGYQTTAGSFGTATGGNILNINGTNGEAGFNIGTLGLSGAGGHAFADAGSPSTCGAATTAEQPGGGGGGGGNGGAGGAGGAGLNADAAAAGLSPIPLPAGA